MEYMTTDAEHHFAVEKADFSNWLATAAPKEKFEYARAMSLQFPFRDDKGRIDYFKPPSAHAAYAAHTADLVTLVQKRLSHGKSSKFSYLAIRR